MTPSIARSTARTLRRRILCAACAGALALAATPSLADAEGNTGSTTVTIKAAGTGEGGASGAQNISFTVPTVIPFYAQPDGTLIGPSGDSYQIENKSVFAIHVTSVAVAKGAAWNIVADARGTDQENAASFEIGPAGATVQAASALSGKDTSNDPAWNLGYAGSETDALALQSSGSIANVTENLTETSTLATITWTVAAGSAS